MVAHHEPVLVSPVLQLATDATRVVDCTVGLGGHTLALAPGRSVMGIDRDPAALSLARARLPESVVLRQGRFGDPDVLDAVAQFAPDFILVDLGVSSLQLDVDERGFTFRPGTRLDMRMEPAGPSAAEWLQSASEQEIASALRDYADERRSRALAREIVRRRARSMETADDLVNAIRAVLGPRAGPADFARLFQAVRIVVNDEMTQLSAALPALRDALQSEGGLAVISYHSGEDRIVKLAFREWARACVCPPELPVCRCRGRPLGVVLTRKPIRPDADEVTRNPRSRSARLRAFRVA